MIAKGWMAKGGGDHQSRSLRVPGVGQTRLYCVIRPSSLLTPTTQPRPSRPCSPQETRVERRAAARGAGAVAERAAGWDQWDQWPCREWSHPAGGETQQPQGIAETGTSGTSGTSKKEEHGLNHPCGPTAAQNPGAHSKTVVPLVPVVPPQQLRGFEVEPPARSTSQWSHPGPTSTTGEPTCAQ